MSRWLVDTSVAVPAIIATHSAHAMCRHAIAGRDVVLAAQSALETYSVLTRLPGDARLAAADAATVISELFGSAVAVPVKRSVGLVDEFAASGCRRPLCTTV